MFFKKLITKYFDVWKMTPCSIKLKAKNKETLSVKYDNHINNCDMCQHNIILWHNEHINECRICKN